MFPDFDSIPEYADYFAKRFPDREALACERYRLDYLALRSLSVRFARALQAAGCRSGERVALWSHSDPVVGVLLIACARIGAILVGLDPAAGATANRERIAATQPKLLLAAVAPGHDGETPPDCDSVTTLHGRIDAHSNLSETFLELLNARGTATGARFDNNPPGPDAGLTIVCTSGSTGEPKGALLSQTNVIAAKRAFERAYEGRENLLNNLRVYNPVSITLTAAQIDVLCIPLMFGGMVYCDQELNVDCWAKAIANEKLTLLYASPLFHAMRLSDPAAQEFDASSVTSIAWAGAAATGALIEQLQQSGSYLWCGYGVTEAGTIITVTTPDTDRRLLGETVGTLPPDYECRIVDTYGRDVAVTESGELLLRGPGVCLGYWRDAEHTAKVVDENGWFHTGDIARLDNDGNLSILGRRSEIFTQNGVEVCPRRIEEVISRHPDVDYVAVVGAREDDEHWAGHAHIVPLNGVSISDEQLRDHCRKYLQPELIPTRFIRESRLPMLPSAKVDLRHLD